MSDMYVLRGKQAVRVDSAEEWARMFEGDRHVAQTEAAPGIRVSTVFLGINHNFRHNGPPLLFETMVFNDYGDDGTQERYSTWDEAEQGHRRIVDEQRRKLADRS